jgi:hypothetical protein
MRGAALSDGDPRVAALTEAFVELEAAVAHYRAAIDAAGLEG